VRIFNAGLSAGNLNFVSKGMYMKRRVVITGLGVVAPNGIGKEAFWQSLKDGKSGIKKISYFDATTYPSQIAGEVHNFDPLEYMDPKTAKRMDRFSQFALASAKMALDDAGVKPGDNGLENAGIVIGSAIGGVPHAEEQHSIFIEKGLRRVSSYLAIRLFTGAAASQISIAFGIKGYSNTIGGACTAGADALGYAFDIVRKGESDMMIAGGAEAPLAPLTFASFCTIDAISNINGDPKRASRPFDAERNGFVMSEGAGVVILEELEHALKRKVPIYAEVLGYGTTFDAFHMVHPLPDGEQAKKAIKLSLADAEIDPDEIDYINAHGTSTILNDKIETGIIKKIFGERAYQIPINATKSMTGHTIGASGSLECIATALSIKEQFVHPTINYEYPDPECDLDYVPNVGRPAKIKCALSNSFGFGGKNSALIFRKVKF
jgi:3-oxoacyl-[acyl-carrier-protein] synthase II